VKVITGWIGTAWDTAWQHLKDAASTAKDVIMAPFNAVKTTIDTILGLIEDLVRKIKGIHVPHIPNPFGKGSPAGAATPAGVGVGTFAAAPAVSRRGLHDQR
jgi:hypothetical protein